MAKFLFIVLFFVSLKGFAAELPLQQFLSQVQGQHDSYKSAQMSAEGAKLYQHEADLAVRPNLFADAENDNDQKPGVIFSYDRQLTNIYDLGVSDQTSFGLSGKLYYTLTDMQYQGFSISGLPASFASTIPSTMHTVQGSPVLQLTFPLWRNWLGAETRSQVQQGEATAEAQIHAKTFQMKSMLVQAETSYWQLALAREAVKVSQDAVDRAMQLLKWHQRRAQLGLADRADLLQSEAALDARKIDLKDSDEQEEAAARTFNSMRGMNSNVVSETLLPLTPNEIHQLTIPPRQGDRDDVQAAYYQAQAAEAAAELERQKTLPTLELFGTYALNNPDIYSASVLSDSFDLSRPTQIIGIRLNAPLDFGLIEKVRQGREKDKLAAEYSYQRQRFDQDSNWQDLVEKYGRAKDRFDLYQDLERAQRVKLDYERERRMRGRTTTQQVINFEQDYEQAQLGRIRTLSELLQLRAQMKLFNGAPQ